VIAATQACCDLIGVQNLIGVLKSLTRVFQLGLQSSTGVVSMHRVLGIVLVQQLVKSRPEWGAKSRRSSCSLFCRKSLQSLVSAPLHLKQYGKHGLHIVM